MSTPANTPQSWHFGLFEVDASRVELRRNGSPVKLREQSFLVLIQLLQHAGELVTREELRQALWPSDTFVDFDHSLSTAVMKLREALGDSTGTPAYIETVPKHGYRFIAKVTAVDQNHAAVVEQNPAVAPTPAPLAAKPRSRGRVTWLLAGLAAVLLASLPWIAFHWRSAPAPTAIARFQIPAPDKLMFLPWDIAAVSPDGQSIAFTAGNLIDANDRLFVRPLNRLTTTEIPVPGIDVHNPFWSPDGRQIAFMNNALTRVDVSGGPPVTICTCGAWLGGTWNRDGVIVFSSVSSKTTDVLSRVSAVGGEAKPLRPLAPGETTQAWPQFLPDGKHYLYLSLGKAPNQQGIYAASLDSGDRKFIVATNTNATYLQSGQLLYIHGNVLMAQPFDLHALKLSGEPRPVADHIDVLDINGLSVFARANFAASPDGVIVWRHAPNTTLSSLQWFDRSGKKLDTVGEPAEYYGLSLSPDNSKLAASIVNPTNATKAANIWIFDLRSGGKTRLTIDPARDLYPVWSPDGTRIAFTSDRSGQPNIYWKPADGSQPAQLVLAGKDQKEQENLEDWSRDGKYLVYNTGGFVGRPAHIYVLPLADRKPVPFVDGNFTAHDSQISPNGRWIAYMSREAGLPQVFVERFDLGASQPRGKWQVSSLATAGGGEFPRWRRDGKELYYHIGNEYFAVDVKTDGPSFEAGVPKLLFESRPFMTHQGPYVVTSDGQRFLEPEAIDKPVAIDVLVGWR